MESIVNVEMFTLVSDRDRDRDRDKDPLFPIVPVSFPVLVPVPFLCSVNKQLAL